MYPKVINNSQIYLKMGNIIRLFLSGVFNQITMLKAAHRLSDYILYIDLLTFYNMSQTGSGVQCLKWKLVVKIISQKKLKLQKKERYKSKQKSFVSSSTLLVTLF